jgi:hypothetical protein
MAEVYEVVDAEKRSRVLFSGPEVNARAFVEANAPRVHAENGTAVPSVLLRPEGTKDYEYYSGPEDAEPWKKFEEE